MKADIRTRIELSLADVVADPIQFSAMRDAAVDAVRKEMARQHRNLRKATWQHRCSDKVGGCMAISQSALSNIGRDL